MYFYKANPSAYTRCERCRHIDRDKEECKVTNDKWLVCDNAGDCKQYEEVEGMKVKCINNNEFKRFLTLNKEYSVEREYVEDGTTFYVFKINDDEFHFKKDRFEIVEKNTEKISNKDKGMSRIDLLCASDKTVNKLHAIENLCPSTVSLSQYEGHQCAGDNEYGCCARCWNEPATKEETERLLPKDKGVSTAKSVNIDNIHVGDSVKMTEAGVAMSNLDKSKWYKVVRKDRDLIGIEIDYNRVLDIHKDFVKDIKTCKDETKVDTSKCNEVTVKLNLDKKEFEKDLEEIRKGTEDVIKEIENKVKHTLKELDVEEFIKHIQDSKIDIKAIAIEKGVDIDKIASDLASKMKQGLKGNCTYETKSRFDNTPIKPHHYKAGDFDVIAFCFEHDIDFALGNVIKYVTRAGKKDKDKELEDLLKAREYLNRKIENLGGR